ncbi:MAG: AAA family ATPase [bacterium]
MDYIKLLNLQSEPFSNSPDPSFFFLSKTYLDCLQNLEISIRLRRGLNLVVGDIGTGKTTLSRALIQQFQAEVDRFLFHLILDPSFKSEYDFLHALIMGFGITRPAVNSSFAYKEAIRQFLLDEGVQKGRVIVLIVDEGQKLNDVCLELLRDLLNFETNQYKLLQLIIMAQKEFHEKIRDKRNLTDRINTFHTIRPLDRNETQDMIQFRLRKAGWTKSRPLFSQKAIDRIYHYSEGYPRRIITLCHHSLLLMLIRKADVVEPDIVENAISQLYEYEEGAGADGVSLPSKGIASQKPRKGFSLSRRLRTFPVRRLFNPVLSASLIFLLFVTLLWGTKHMNWINREGAIEEPIASVTREAPITPAEPDEAGVSADVPLAGTGISEPSYTGQVARIMDELKEPEEDRREDVSEVIPMIVSEGDTILRLARRIYRSPMDQSLLEKIRGMNPHIPDLDHIEVGERVFFPRFSDSGAELLAPSFSAGKEFPFGAGEGDHENR